MDPWAPGASRARIAPREIFGSGKVSAGTSVQSEPIYVVIPLRVDRSICGMHAALRDKLYCRTEPAYPPRAGPCDPPRSPPRRGGSLFLADPSFPSGPFGPLPGPCSLWGRPGDDPHTPGCRLRRAKAWSRPGSQRSSIPALPRISGHARPCARLASCATRPEYSGLAPHTHASNVLAAPRARTAWPRGTQAPARYRRVRHKARTRAARGRPPRVRAANNPRPHPLPRWAHPRLPGPEALGQVRGKKYLLCVKKPPKL